MVTRFLQVWDGTMCADPFLNVSVEEDALEGSLAAVGGRHNLVANVLVYDNHVEVARGLKVRSRLSDLCSLWMEATTETIDHSIETIDQL